MGAVATAGLVGWLAARLDVAPEQRELLEVARADQSLQLLLLVQAQLCRLLAGLAGLLPCKALTLGRAFALGELLGDHPRAFAVAHGALFRFASFPARDVAIFLAAATRACPVRKAPPRGDAPVFDLAARGETAEYSCNGARTDAAPGASFELGAEAGLVRPRPPVAARHIDHHVAHGVVETRSQPESMPL